MQLKINSILCYFLALWSFPEKIQGVGKTSSGKFGKTKMLQSGKRKRATSHCDCGEKLMTCISFTLRECYSQCFQQARLLLALSRGSYNMQFEKTFDSISPSLATSPQV